MNFFLFFFSNNYDGQYPGLEHNEDFANFCYRTYRCTKFIDLWDFNALMLHENILFHSEKLLTTILISISVHSENTYRFFHLVLLQFPFSFSILRASFNARRTHTAGIKSSSVHSRLSSPNTTDCPVFSLRESNHAT